MTLVNSKRYEKLAAKLAEEALKSPVRCQHAATLLHGRKAVAPVHNNFRTCYGRDSERCSGHAEVSAIWAGRAAYHSDSVKISRLRLKKNELAFYETSRHRLNLLVIRVQTGKDGRIYLAESRPCDDCVSLMKKFGIERVFYSTAEGTIVSEKVAEMEKCHRTQGFAAISEGRVIGA